jgi:hypothetical protein
VANIFSLVQYLLRKNTFSLVITFAFKKTGFPIGSRNMLFSLREHYPQILE